MSNKDSHSVTSGLTLQLFEHPDDPAEKRVPLVAQGSHTGSCQKLKPRGEEQVVKSRLVHIECGQRVTVSPSEAGGGPISSGKSLFNVALTVVSCSSADLCRRAVRGRVDPRHSNNEQKHH